MAIRFKKFSPFSCIRKSPSYLAAKKICALLQSRGFQAYLVGGCVRDLVRSPRHLPKDLDIATSAPIEAISNLFPQTHSVGNAFAVCLVHFQSFSFEIASFRSEGKYLDRRRPESVASADFESDSNRRDFTINALYFDITKNQIIDVHDGLTDLKNKQIRCVGNPNDRLYEDSLRIVRLCRFAADFNLEIDTKTFHAAQNHADGISTLPQERILLEFSKTKNIKPFVLLFSRIIPLHFLFPTGHTFFDMDKPKKWKLMFFPKTEFPLFDFIHHLTLHVQLNFQNLNLFLNEIKNFRSFKKDLLICQEYLRIIAFESIDLSSFDQDHIQFLFYLKLMHFKRHFEPAFFEKMSRNISCFILSQNLNQEMDFILKTHSQKNCYSPKMISEVVLALHLPNSLIQTTIDYIEYRCRKGDQIQDISLFISNQISFIQKISTF